MYRRLLSYKPTHWFCPFCGDWHRYEASHELKYYNSDWYSLVLRCAVYRETLAMYFSTHECRYKIREQNYNQISRIKMDDEDFSMRFSTDYGAITKFKFYKEDYEGCKLPQKIVEEPEPTPHQEDEPEPTQIQENREEINMAKAETKKTTLKEQLWEHSPKENVELIKTWAEKYKPTLKWIVPVGCIYAAYRILNSRGFSIEKINDICEKELGFEMTELKDKTMLKKLTLVGGLTAGAYAAVKATSAIFENKDPEEICMEDVEKNMGKLAGVSEKFAWLQPKTEELLPIAISVITVYVLTQKELPFGEKINNKINILTEDWKIKAEVYGELITLFAKDKFNIDLSEPEERQKVKKFAFLAIVVAVIAFLYGKKMLGSKYAETENEVSEEDKPLQKLIDEVLNIMKKMAPALFGASVTALAAKKILKAEATEDVIDVDATEVEPEAAEEVLDEAVDETLEEAVDESLEDETAPEDEN